MADIVKARVVGDWRRVVGDQIVSHENTEIGDVGIHGKVALTPVWAKGGPQGVIANPGAHYSIQPVECRVRYGRLYDPTNTHPFEDVVVEIDGQPLVWRATFDLAFRRRAGEAESKLQVREVTFDSTAVVSGEIALTSLIPAAAVPAEYRGYFANAALSATAADDAKVEAVEAADTATTAADLATSAADIANAKAQAAAGAVSLAEREADRAVGLATAQDSAVAATVTAGGPTTTALNATYGPEIMQEVITAEAEAPSGVIARRGGKTRTDGQNIRNLRRPTLAVDRMWPNELSDHQIVYVDETTREAYSVGHDQAFRKATWAAGHDQALLWGYPRSTAPADGTRWCEHGVFIKIPGTGELLMDSWGPAAAATQTLLRSTNEGVTWTTVWTAPNRGKYFLGPQSVVRDEITGYLYLVEYGHTFPAPAPETMDIWRSTDKGATWSVWASLPRGSGAGAITHWHSARYDHVSQRVYFMAGDPTDAAGIYRTKADGTGIEPVVINSQLKHLAPSAARAVDMMFFPNHIAWPVDGAGGGQNWLYRMHRSQIGASDPEVEQVAAINSTGWWCTPVRNDRSMWLFSTSTEPQLPTTGDEGIAHLYAVSDGGATVDEVGAVTMDSGVGGFASISGLGSNSPAVGDAFWLRAHTYRRLPHRASSAFQMRARLGFGVVPITPPNLRTLIYNQQSRAVPPVTLAPGETKAFGYCWVPDQTTVMSLIDVGCLALNPLTYGGGKVVLWNVTKNALLYEYAGTSIATSTRQGTEIRQTTLACSARDVIEFRVTNIHATATLNLSAYVEFGWSF